MPKSITEPASEYSPLDDEITHAKEEVRCQKETIENLAAEGHEVRDAEEKLNAMLENFAFLIKLGS